MTNISDERLAEYEHANKKGLWFDWQNVVAPELIAEVRRLRKEVTNWKEISVRHWNALYTISIERDNLRAALEEISEIQLQYPGVWGGPDKPRTDVKEIAQKALSTPPTASDGGSDEASK